MGNIRIIIVEPDEGVQTRLWQFLQAETDIEIIDGALDGKAAVSLVQYWRPNIVLLAVDMPKCFALTRTMKKEVPSLKLILMSHEGQADDLRQALKSGADDFLVKPVAANDLVMAIRRLDGRSSGKS